MVNKTTRNSELRIDLASLIKYNSAAQTVNLNSIELYYERSEVVWTLPPQANLESSTVTAIWIDRVRYPGVAAWTAGWARAVRSNQAQGIAVSVGRPRTVTAVNLAKPDGTRLTASAVTPAAVTTTTIPTVQQVTTAPQLSVPGPRGDTGAAGLRGLQGLTGDRGPTGLQGVGVQTLAVNEQGNLIVTLSNSATVDAGYVVGPSPVLTVGTVMAGATPSVSITGGPTNYALNFVLQAGPAGPGSGDVSTLSLYDDPVWINSLTASKITGLTASSVGLANVTNESKATMFTSPTFTGTVSGVTATHVGLGNVTNESKATMFTSPTFTGTVTGVIPSGVITLWSGSIVNIPSGWLLCDGTNGTPNLRDRFVIGAGSTYAVAATGGSANAIVVSHTHTATSTVTDPGHFHVTDGTLSSSRHAVRAGVDAIIDGSSGTASANDADYLSGSRTGSQTTGITVATTNSTEGSSGTNANLPPYYALAYIMKS